MLHQGMRDVDRVRMSITPIGPTIIAATGIQGPSATASELSSAVATISVTGPSAALELELTVLGKALQAESALVDLHV